MDLYASRDFWMQRLGTVITSVKILLTFASYSCSNDGWVVGRDISQSLSSLSLLLLLLLLSMLLLLVITIISNIFFSFHPSACSSALGVEDYHIPYPSILSTSFFGAFTPHRGRLFSSTYPWMAATTDRNAFLQISVGITDHVITAVATQGHKTYKAAVVKFQLSFSSDSLQWFDYREDGDVRVNMWFNIRKAGRENVLVSVCYVHSFLFVRLAVLLSPYVF